jgi:hypothetical protein
MKNNVKEHTASPEDTQNNQTDGRGLDVSPCSASSLLSEDTLYAHWCSSMDETNGVLIDFREHKQDIELAELGYTASGNDLIKNGNVVGKIKRGLQMLDFNVPFPHIIP